MSMPNAKCQMSLATFYMHTTIHYYNIFLVFHVNSYYLPLKKGMALHLNKLEFNSHTQGCFVPSLVKIGTEVLEKKMKMCKVYDNDDGQWTNYDQKSSPDPKAQVS